MSNKEKQRLRAERAAAALARSERRERRRQILTAVGVLAAIALVVGGGFLINSLRDDTKATAATIPPPGSAYGVTIGAADAPHQVVVYEDFLCPYLRGVREDRPRAAWPRSPTQGKVQIEYRPFVLLDRPRPLLRARST